MGALCRTGITWVELRLRAGFAACGVGVHAAAAVLCVDVHRACRRCMLQLKGAPRSWIKGPVRADHDRIRHALNMVTLPITGSVTHVDGSAPAFTDDIVHTAVWCLAPRALHFTALVGSATDALAPCTAHGVVPIALWRRVGGRCRQRSILYGRRRPLASLRRRGIIRRRLKLGVRNRL